MLLFFFIPLVYVVCLSPIYSQTHLQSCKVSLNMIKHIRKPIFLNNVIYLFTFGWLRPGMASLVAERGLEGVWASVVGHT